MMDIDRQQPVSALRTLQWAGLCLLALFSSSSLQAQGYPEINVTISGNIMERPQVDAALAMFKRACAPLFTRHAQDIVKIDALAHEPYGAKRRACTWSVLPMRTSLICASSHRVRIPPHPISTS
jgi:hypothetical protein